MLQQLLIFIILIITIVISSCLDNYIKKLDDAINITDNILNNIINRWQINQFPNFLRSAAMSQTSWEVLKLKYQEKILKSVMIEKDINITSNISNKNDIINVKFLISLLGSSVTAGHDSPFNESFSELLGPIMEPAFAPFFKLEVKNGALGNNPCLPYDVCVRTFAGADADIVHWEQSFNCFGTDAKKSYVFEQFIRQALTMPNKPVIAFSDSAMPNWKEDVCKEPAAKSPVTISPEEKRMLDYLRTGNAMKVVSELNKNEINRPWSALLNLFKEYKTLGIQMWLHDHYERYKCHGPYVATWGCCSRSWHPSLLGHQLRAAHFAFFWLLIYKDALVELRKNGSEMLLKELHDAKKHIDHELKHIPTKAIFDPMGFSDNMQCYTTFQPLGDPSLDMFKIVIPSGEGKNGFKNIIFEELTSPEIIKKAKASGYLDFKHLLYGNIDSGVLSFNITVQKVGVAFLCQPCGNWGKLPNGFKYFWEIGTQIYLTKDIAAIPEGQFNFSPEKATNLKYTNRAPKDSQTICVDFEMQFPAGQHILTIVPTTKDNIMVSYLLLP